VLGRIPRAGTIRLAAVPDSRFLAVPVSSLPLCAGQERDVLHTVMIVGHTLAATIAFASGSLALTAPVTRNSQDLWIGFLR
jgi:hypothetical protein